MQSARPADSDFPLSPIHDWFHTFISSATIFIEDYGPTPWYLCTSWRALICREHVDDLLNIDNRQSIIGLSVVCRVSSQKVFPNKLIWNNCVKITCPGVLEGEVDRFGEFCFGGLKCCWHYIGHHGFICIGSCVKEAGFQDVGHVGVAHKDHSSRS